MSTTKKASSTKPKTSSTRKTSSTKPATSKPATTTKPPPTTTRPTSTRPTTPSTTSVTSTSSSPETSSSFTEESSSSSETSSDTFLFPPPVFSPSPSLPSSSSELSSSSFNTLFRTTAAPIASETFESSSTTSLSSSIDEGVGGFSEASEIKKVPVSAVAGGAAGGLVVGCLVVIGIIFCRRKRRAKGLSTRIAPDEPKHPFYPMDTFAPSTTEFTPVPYPVGAASPTRNEEKVRLSAGLGRGRYSSPQAVSQRGSTSPSSFQLETDPFATHTYMTSRIEVPYRDNSTPTQQSPPSSVTNSSEKDGSRGRVVSVSGTGTSMTSELPVMQHEDSGVRVTGREQGVLEVPPAYTPR